MICNVPHSARTRDDAFAIRQDAIRNRILCVTTVAGVRALVNGLRELRDDGFSVRPLQELHALPR